MENAAKALIIAGAILISIILISIGIIVVNQGKEVVDEAGQKMSQQQIQIFNADFDTYNGTQRGSTVKTFLSVVAANNSTHKDDGLAITVSGPKFTSGTKKPNELSQMQASISTTKKYVVTLLYDEDTGRINGAKIEEAKSGTSGDTETL